MARRSQSSTSIRSRRSRPRSRFQVPAVGLAADVTDRGAMQQVVAQVVERFGGVDVVVANAGIASRGATTRSMSGEAFDRVLDVNLNGVHRTVTAPLPEIISRRGHVVVVASVYAFVNGLGAAPYAMSKAGVEQLGRALRVELAQHGAGRERRLLRFHRYLDGPPDRRCRSTGLTLQRHGPGLSEQAAATQRGRQGDRRRDRETGTADHQAAPLGRLLRSARGHQPVAGQPDGAARRDPGDRPRARRPPRRGATDHR